VKQVGVLALPDELAQWEPHVTAASQAHGVPESLIYAVMSRESRGGLALRELCGDWTARVGHWLTVPNVLLAQTLPDGWKPPRDAGGNVLRPPCAIPEDRLGWGRGLMQLDYESARDFDWSDPMLNIDAGAKLLRALVDEFPRNLRAAVAAYNCGPGNVRKALLAGRDEDWFTTGRDYSADVLRRQKSFLQEQP
jgi:hypothetical protein